MYNNHQFVWRKCLEVFKSSLDADSYQTWFEPIVPLNLIGGVLTIQIPSHYFYEIIEEHYIDLVSRCLKEFIGTNAKLEYKVVMVKSDEQTSYTVNLPTGNKTNNYNKITNGKKLQVNPQLNSDYTFDNFIEGDCNKLARVAGLTISQKPGETAFNPLVIFGKSGLGKTHLAQAIGAETKRRFPQKNVLYVSANTFVVQFQDSHIANTRNDFINFYQQIDVLIIDDIHDFIGKTQTQNTFFHIFNHLHQTKKQLVLTCDQPPAELKGMEERLLSRFKWGLQTELTVPDYETRVKILEHKMSKDGIKAPADVVHYIATNMKNNVRELESALISLLALSTLNKAEINLKTAENIIGKLIKKDKKELSLNDIKLIVCKYFGIEPEALESKSRKREIVQARQIAMYFAKNKTNYSSTAIGAIVGDKDHATVLYACKTINNLIETDKEFKSKIIEIEGKLLC